MPPKSASTRARASRALVDLIPALWASAGTGTPSGGFPRPVLQGCYRSGHHGWSVLGFVGAKKTSTTSSRRPSTTCTRAGVLRGGRLAPIRRQLRRGAGGRGPHLSPALPRLRPRPRASACWTASRPNPSMRGAEGSRTRSIRSRPFSPTKPKAEVYQWPPRHPPPLLRGRRGRLPGEDEDDDD